jgi:glycosyltransferase involved in cell wall biosynthesis
MKGGAGDRIRLCRVATVPWLFQTLLREQLRCIVAAGIDLTLVSSPSPELAEIAADVGAVAVAIPMERAPAPRADLLALHRLRRFFAQGRFDVVHSVSPKSGLLSALGGALARVPVRLHTFTGQPWVELRGLKRQIPRMCDRLTALLATHVYADSPSQRDFLVAEGLVQSEKISVLGPGSIAGVDSARFSGATWGGEMARKTRRELGFPDDATVIIFVGRVTQDKGIVELVSAFRQIAAGEPRAHLLLVGPLEPERDPLPGTVLDVIKNHGRIRAIGFSATPEKYLAAADIFCVPSYREGFGTVAVEAAAAGLPTVVTKIVGLVDAVEAGVTGLAVPVKNVTALAEALQALVAAPGQRAALGEAGRRRAERLFDAATINQLVVAEYIRAVRGTRAAGLSRHA